MDNIIIGNSQYKIINISADEICKDTQGHIHSSKSYELHYVLAGSGYLHTKDNSYKLEENTVYIAGPSVWHKQSVSKDNPIKEICVYIQLEKAGDDYISNSFNSNHIYCGTDNEELKNLFLKVQEQNEKSDIYSYEKKRAYIQLIITELAGIYSPQIASSKKTTINDEQFYIIESLFLNEYASITLESLASRLGISQRQTQRLLQSYYGKTFRQIKRDAQCEAGLLMLENGANTNEVASLVGYSDTSSFLRAIKQNYGKTLREKLT